MSLRIALVGLGEVGVMLADDLAGRAALSAWDVTFADPDSKASAALKTRNVAGANNAADAVREADLVISAVTAAQTVAAARAAAAGLKRGAYFLDLNSASPAAKAEAAAIIAASGGRYVEAAVMAPVAPKRLATPLLLGGPDAEAFLPLAHELGFAGARFYDAELGRAAAAKLCRSVIVKGVEALLVESLLAARHYQVEKDVIASLSDLFPGPDWQKLSAYMISRAVEHGVRRAEEMREAARTVRDAGLTPWLSDAIATRQDWTAATFSGRAADSLEDLHEALRANREKA